MTSRSQDCEMHSRPLDFKYNPRNNKAHSPSFNKSPGQLTCGTQANASGLMLGTPPPERGEKCNQAFIFMSSSWWALGKAAGGGPLGEIRRTWVGGELMPELQQSVDLGQSLSPQTCCTFCLLVSWCPVGHQDPPSVSIQSRPQLYPSSRL